VPGRGAARCVTAAPAERPGGGHIKGLASSHRANYTAAIQRRTVVAETPVRKLPTCNCQSIEKPFPALLRFSSAATTRPAATQHSPAGHVGDPREATAEKGEKLFKAFTDDAVKFLERVISWDGSSWNG